MRRLPLLLPFLLAISFPLAASGGEGAPPAASPQAAPARGEAVPRPAAVARTPGPALAPAPAKDPVPAWKRPWPSPLGDPRRGEVRLPAAEGWRASLVLENRSVGVWAVKSFPVLGHLAAPELVALDDYGRLHLLVVYSGKWSSLTAVNDGWWLGGLVQVDLDPALPGPELYTGSKAGRLWQVVAHEHGALESRLVGRIEGREIHTLAAGDLDPTRDGNELLVFTSPGGAYLATPSASGRTFDLRHLADLRGRTRDALVLPAAPGRPPEIAAVSRDGTLRLFRLEDGALTSETVYEAPMGLGRLAAAPGKAGVLYATHDDGRILRFERTAGEWKTETIYLGPQGPRGIVAAALGATPDVETVAIFGYSRKVELLTREEKGWQVETLFLDLDAGHWLAAVEVDGRNATRELAACGFGGRVILLSREPGFGRPELAEPSGEER